MSFSATFKRFFTPQEANGLLPEVRRLVSTHAHLGPKKCNAQTSFWKSPKATNFAAMHTVNSKNIATALIESGLTLEDKALKSTAPTPYVSHSQLFEMDRKWFCAGMKENEPCAPGDTYILTYTTDTLSNPVAVVFGSGLTNRAPN